MPALTAAERARTFRARHSSAAARREDKYRKRRERDQRVRNAPDLGSNTVCHTSSVLSVEGITSLAAGWDERRRRHEEATGLPYIGDPITEDAYQEAYLKTLERAPRFTDARQVVSYVRRTARGAAVDLARVRDRDDDLGAILKADDGPADDARESRRLARIERATAASDSLEAGVTRHLSTDPRVDAWIRNGGLGDGRANVLRIGSLTVRFVRGIRNL